MHVASSTLANDAADPSDRIGRGIALALAIYLTLVTWPIKLEASATGSAVPLAVHLTILGYTLILLAAPARLRRPALDWLTLTIGPLMYIELRWINAGIGAPQNEAVVVERERRLFP